MLERGLTHICVNRAEFNEDKISVTAGQFLTAEESRALYEALHEVYGPKEPQVTVHVHADTQDAEAALKRLDAAAREPAESDTPVLNKLHEELGVTDDMPGLVILNKPAAERALLRLLDREIRAEENGYR